MSGTLLQIEVLDSMIPITRFNKGEAGKIFEEVEKTGMKIAIKNNQPACILLPVGEYKEIIETIKDYKLLIEAQNRLLKAENKDWINHTDILKKFNISEDDLDDEDVEIE